MRVLVTGARSLLGGLTAQALAARGDDVVVLQRGASGLGLAEVLGDIADPAAVREAVHGCDAVVHLAARVGVVGTPEQFRLTNVEGTRVLLRRRPGPGSEVRSGVVAVGGTKATRSWASGPPRGPSAHAATTAHQGRGRGCSRWRPTPRFAVVAVRPHLVWGPGDTQLVGRIVERARAGRLALVDDGRPRRHHLRRQRGRRAGSALDAAGRNAREAFVVTTGEPRTVRALFARMCRAAGLAPPRLRVPFAVAAAGGAAAERVWAARGRDDDPPMTRFLAEQLGTAHWFDQRRTREALGWRPRLGLEEGFARLAASLRG
jgi:nucleoside-diphosphate-sugar epimerase